MSNGPYIDPAVFDAMAKQAAAKYGASVAASPATDYATQAVASKLGLGSLINFSPLALFAAMDLFGDKGFGPAVETTPEQDALLNIDTKAMQVAEAMDAEGGTEGATEALEDAIAEGMLLGLSPTEIVAPVLNQRIPGVKDVPIIGDVITGAMDKAAEAIDKVLDRTGLGDYRADAVFSKKGASITFEPKGSSTTQRTGSPPMGTSNVPGGSTATPTTGNEEGDLVLTGGTGADVVEAKAGVVGIEAIHFVLSQTCGDDETYDRATFSCIPKFGTGTKKAEKITCPSEYENAGAEVDSLGECGDKKSTVITGDPCDDPAYAAINPDICADAGGTTEGTDEITVDDPCLDPEYKAANPIQCGDMGPKLDPCDDPDYAAANPVQCGDTPPIIDPDPCDDPEYAAANPAQCDPNYDPCDNPAYAAENPVECGGQPPPPPEDPCDNPAYAAENPVECGSEPPPPPDPCDDPAYAAENPIECGGTPPPPPDPCDDPVYAAENPIECGGTPPPPPDPCDDPVYAAENPIECGGTPTDPCLNPAYAAENPIECGGTPTDPCLNPGYAAENPEECGVDTNLCSSPAYAFLNPEECMATPTTAGLMPTLDGRFVFVEPGERGELEYLYDIGGESIFAPTIQAASGGKIDNYDLLREVEDLLRGR